MALDALKAKFEDCADKIKNDPARGEKFKAHPVKTLEELTGLDLPDEQVRAAAAFVKAKVAGVDAGELLGKVTAGVGNVAETVKDSGAAGKVEKTAGEILGKVKGIFGK